MELVETLHCGKELAWPPTPDCFLALPWLPPCTPRSQQGSLRAVGAGEGRSLARLGHVYDMPAVAKLMLSHQKNP